MLHIDTGMFLVLFLIITASTDVLEDMCRDPYINNTISSTNFSFGLCHYDEVLSRVYSFNCILEGEAEQSVLDASSITECSSGCEVRLGSGSGIWDTIMVTSRCTTETTVCDSVAYVYQEHEYYGDVDTGGFYQILSELSSCFVDSNGDYYSIECESPVDGSNLSPVSTTSCGETACDVGNGKCLDFDSGCYLHTFCDTQVDGASKMGENQCCSVGDSVALLSAESVVQCEMVTISEAFEGSRFVLPFSEMNTQFPFIMDFVQSCYTYSRYVGGFTTSSLSSTCLNGACVDPDKTHRNVVTALNIVGIVAGVILAILSLGIGCFCVYSKKHRQQQQQGGGEAEEGDTNINSVGKIFTVVSIVVNSLFIVVVFAWVVPYMVASLELIEIDNDWSIGLMLTLVPIYFWFWAPILTFIALALLSACVYVGGGSSLIFKERRRRSRNVSTGFQIFTHSLAIPLQALCCCFFCLSAPLFFIISQLQYLGGGMSDAGHTKMLGICVFFGLLACAHCIGFALCGIYNVVSCVGWILDCVRAAAGEGDGEGDGVEMANKVEENNMNPPQALQQAGVQIQQIQQPPKQVVVIQQTPQQVIIQQPAAGVVQGGLYGHQPVAVIQGQQITQQQVFVQQYL